MHAGSGELSCKQVWRNSETARKASGFNRVVKTHEDRRVDGLSWACSLPLHFQVRCGQLRWITLEAFLLRFHRTDPRTHSVRAPTCVAMGFRCFVFGGGAYGEAHAIHRLTGSVLQLLHEAMHFLTYHGQGIITALRWWSLLPCSLKAICFCSFSFGVGHIFVTSLCTIAGQHEMSQLWASRKSCCTEPSIPQSHQ